MKQHDRDNAQRMLQKYGVTDRADLHRQKAQYQQRASTPSMQPVPTTGTQLLKGALQAVESANRMASQGQAVQTSREQVQRFKGQSRDRGYEPER
ncbi:hypothetical protein D3C75_1085480 [compost metagenome]